MNNKAIKIDLTIWIVAGFSLLTVLALFLGGRGPLLRIAIPAAVTVIALLVYVKKPVAYVQLALWVWLLTPFVRRVVDWRVGFADQNLILLTPLLVSCVSIFTVLRYTRDSRVRLAPFILCGVGVMYGFFVGMALRPSAEVVYGLVNWMAPLLLGLHLYLDWPNCQKYSAAVQRTAIYGLLFIGIYGVIQFFYPPIWDTMWLENLPGGLESSTFGRPLPQEIRVWSTLNAPGPFANVAVALLFLAMQTRSKLKLPAIAIGIFSIVLSLVRTAWVTGIVALLFLAKNSNRKLFINMMMSFVAGFLGIIVLVNSSLDVPFIGERVKSFGDLKNDESVNDRTRLYTNMSTEVLQQPVGIGLNNSDFYKGYPLDSGPIRMLLNLGWFGTLTFSVGVANIIIGMYRRRDKHNRLHVTCLSIVVMFILQLASGLTFISVSGAMFWLAAGLGMASSVSAEVTQEERQKARNPVMLRTWAPHEQSTGSL